MQKKSWEKVFHLREIYISIGYGKLSLLTKEYSWPAINVLKNSPEILCQLVSIKKKIFVTGSQCVNKQS